MAVMAITRVSGMQIVSTFGIKGFDSGWLYFWQQMEACMAVSLVSSTAFRSLFMAHAAKKKEQTPPWYTSTFKRLKRRKNPDLEANLDEVAIPSATITGMRTFIQGGREKSKVGMETIDEYSDYRPLKEKPSDEGIALQDMKKGDGYYVSRSFKDLLRRLTNSSSLPNLPSLPSLLTIANHLIPNTFLLYQHRSTVLVGAKLL
jgi:hypothetical protein